MRALQASIILLLFISISIVEGVQVFAQIPKKEKEAPTDKLNDQKKASTPAVDEKKMSPEEVAAGTAAGAGLFGFSCLTCCGMIAIAFIPYFLPTIIAVFRKHPNTAPIVVVNLLLGWLLVGWVVAMAWALTAQQESRGTSRRRRRPVDDDE